MMPNSSGTVRGSKRVPKVRPERAAHVAGQRREREQHRPVDVRGAPAWPARPRRSGTRAAPAKRPLQRAPDRLLDRDQRDRQRREHAVLDLAGVAELLHHRQRHRLDALDQDRDADHAGDEQRWRSRLAGARAADALADLREHVGEHEDQQERLEDRAGDELLEVLRSTTRSRQQQRPERDARGVRPRAARSAPSVGGASGDGRRWSFAEVLPGEVDEDGLERGLGDRQVGDVKPCVSATLNTIGQHARWRP